MKLQEASGLMSGTGGVGQLDGREPLKMTLKQSLIAGAVVAALLGMVVLAEQAHHHPLAATPVPTMSETAKQELAGLELISNQQLEDRYGIRITLIAVTAAGGIVDFRYKVTDATKAGPFLQKPQNEPVLMAMDSGFKISPTHMGRHHEHRKATMNAVPFTFFPNARHAVKPGTPVSAIFGKLRVEPIVAQ